MVDGPTYQLSAPNRGPVISMASIRDGTSYTAIFSEWIKGTGNSASPHGRHHVYTSASVEAGNTETLDVPSATCQLSVTIVEVRKGNL